MASEHIHIKSGNICFHRSLPNLQKHIDYRFSDVVFRSSKNPIGYLKYRREKQCRACASARVEVHVKTITFYLAAYLIESIRL